MLRKLMKYDLKSLFKLLLPLYGIGLLLAIVNGFLMFPSEFEVNIFQNTIVTLFLELFETISLFSICSIMLITAIWCMIRVYSSVFGKEGYLTNTLPVSHHAILISKVLSSFIAIVASGVVVLLLLILFSYGYFDFVITVEEVQYMVSGFVDSVPALAVVVFVSMALVGALAGMLQVLFSMALGHLTRHPIVLGFVAYLGIQYLVIQPLTSILLFSMIEYLPIFSTAYDGFSSDTALWATYYQVMLIMLVGHALCAVVYYMVTAHILKRKLNLQ